jgi:hypothetical protein
LFSIFKAPGRNREAKRIIEDAEYNHRCAERKLEESRDLCRASISKLGEQKLNIAAKTLLEAHSIFQKLGPHIRISQTKISKTELANFEKYALPEMKHVGIGAGEIVKTGIKGVGAGVGLGYGAYGLAATYGSATTGIAITELAGAAATNATVAWFGGGAIGTGMGMAGGAAVLGGIALVPLALIGAFKYGSAAEKRLTAAHEYSAEVDKAVAQMETATEIVKRIITEVSKFSSVLERLEKLLRASLTKLKVIADKVDAGGEADDKEIKLFYSAALLTKAIKKLLSENLFSEKGDISKEAGNTSTHAESLLSVKNISECKVVTDLASGKKIRTPSKPIQPGNSSDLFFWTSDMKKRSGNWFFKLIKYLVIGYILYVACSGLVSYFHKPQVIKMVDPPKPKIQTAAPVVTPAVLPLVAPNATNSHCTNEEETVFSCKVDEKIISVCSSKNLSKDTGYMQLRIGDKGSLATSFPDTEMHPSNFMEAKYVMFSGGGMSYMRLKSKTKNYVVYSGLGKGWEQEGFAIEQDSKNIGNIICKNTAQSNIMSSEYFTKIGIPEDKNEFEVPIK